MFTSAHLMFWLRYIQNSKVVLKSGSVFRNRSTNKDILECKLNKSMSN